MAEDRKCLDCGVYISSDLSNCPLCGKHIGRIDDDSVNAKSYPIYDLDFIQKTKWYNIIRVIFWIIGIFCVVQNLINRTQPLWCPYVLAFLVMVFHVFIEPIKVSVVSYIKNLAVMSILVSLFLIFIDTYNYYTLKTEFGWAITYAAPFTMSASVLVSTIICFCSKRREVELLKSISFITVISVLYFIMMLVFFKDLVVWPSLMFVSISVGFVALLELFKKNKLIKELKKEFHL